MKRTVIALIAALICQQMASGGPPDDVIQRAIDILAFAPWDNPTNLPPPSTPSADAVPNAVEQLAKLNGKDVTHSLYLAFQRTEQALNQRSTLIKIIRGLPSFEIDVWLDHVEHEPDAMIFSYAVSAAEVSRKSDSPRLKALLLKMLSDKRIAEKRYGEERGYASKGLRICDKAVEILWSREPEASRPYGYPLDAIQPVSQRDEVISAYTTKFNVSVNAHDTPATNPQSVRTSPSTHDDAPSVPSPTSEEPISSTPWSIIVVLTVAAGGLLWLLLKRRS